MTTKKVEANERGGGREGSRRAPKGHFVVYVGRDKDQELTRFVLPLSYLKNLTFKQLLEIAAEEYDNFDKQSRIVLPCDVAAFERFTASLSNHHL